MLTLKNNAVEAEIIAGRRCPADLADAKFANEQTEALPLPFQKRVLSAYVARHAQNPVQANVSLRLMMQKLRRSGVPLYAISSDDRAAVYAKRQAEYALIQSAGNDELFSRFGVLSDLVKRAGLEPPFAHKKQLTRDELQTACLKMICENWWLRQVKQHAAQVREYIAIAVGEVGRGKTQSPYASKNARIEYKARQAAAAEFMAANYLALEVESDSGLTDYEYISLAEASKAGVTSAEIRRLELMTRIRGMERCASEQGFSAMFYTITAPAAYHVNARKRWNGSSPRDTQKYLVGQWAKARAEINDAGIKIAGVRVVEPHNDGTPHWHMLIFVRPEHQNTVTDIMRRYALQHDAHERGAQDNRFQAVTIDRTKGDAVGYIAKYIAKNINAATCENDIDDETGGTLADAVEPVAAWAAVHRIRQFQFIGGAPVTIWRELRRQRSPLADADLEAVREAADRGQFDKFTGLMGGLFVTRNALPVRTATEIRKTIYGEARKAIIGFAGFGVFVETRKQWLRVGRAAAWLFGSASDLQGASRAARSPENNCKSDSQLEKIADELSFLSLTKAVATYLDAAGNWITETVRDYLDYQNEEIPCL